MCFFVILGVVPRERVTGQEMRFCRNCERETMQKIVERQMWFSLFFIPLFPVSRKETIARCNICGIQGSQYPEGYAEPQRKVPSYGGHGIKRCPNCGGEVIEEAAYCQYCGHKF